MNNRSKFFVEELQEPSWYIVVTCGLLGISLFRSRAAFTCPMLGVAGGRSIWLSAKSLTSKEEGSRSSQGLVNASRRSLANFDSSVLLGAVIIIRMLLVSTPHSVDRSVPLARVGVTEILDVVLMKFLLSICYQVRDLCLKLVILFLGTTGVCPLSLAYQDFDLCRQARFI